MSARRPGRRLAVVFALCALALSGTAQVRAQSSPPPYRGTPAETEALDLYRRNRLITARTRAQAALDADPDSIAGHYVMGAVLREAEGDLPRAMWHLGKARQLYEARFGQQFSQSAPWQLHREILFATQALAGEMEEHEFALSILEFHDALYDPDLTAEHAWPLLHLGRFDEARQFARHAIASSDPWQQSLGRNALCAVEAEARQRQPQLAACTDALADARRRVASDPNAASTDPSAHPALTVHAYNAALAALAALRFDEAERVAREGTRRLEFTIANPWRFLTRLYTDEGRVAEAVGAVREMQQWRVRQPASLRDQDRAETDAALASLLLVAGEAETGLRLITRAIERPDRRGLVSSRPEQALGAHALLRRALTRLQAELVSERASWSGTVARARGAFASAGQRLSAWPDDERIVSVLGDDDRLVATFRMYVHGGIEPVPTWLIGDLIPVLGAGVVSVALEDARAAERSVPQLAAYYDAVEAEVALAQGDEARALSLAQRALGALPQAEALLIARTAAVGAEAARRSGDAARENSLFERALQRDPGVIRRLGLAIPAVVRVANGGDVALERAAELLRRSPRLREVERGAFSVALERAPGGGALRACLRTPQGAMLTCTDAAPVRNEAAEDHGARLAEQFHQNTFAMRVGLSTADLRGLDGSGSVAGRAQREMMQGILNDMAREQGGTQ